MRCRACDGCVMRAADDACVMVRMLHARRRIVSRVHVYGLGVSAQKRDSKTRSYIRYNCIAIVYRTSTDTTVFCVNRVWV